MRMMLNNIIIAAGILLLSACTTTKLPAVTAYTINIPNSTGTELAKPKSGKVIRVSIPRSTAAIMSRNILYQGDGYSLNAYSFSKWSDTPNRMLANLFMTMIDDSAMFKAVIPADSSGNSDYILESAVQNFHQQLQPGGTSRANVRIGFYLIETRTGKVIETKEYSSAQNADSTDAMGAVGALNKAAAMIGNDMIEWLSSLKLD